MGAERQRRKVEDGGEVGGVPVALRIVLPVGGGRQLALGLTEDRLVVGEWSPTIPRGWAQDDLARRMNGAIAALLLEASTRPGLQNAPQSFIKARRFTSQLPRM